MRAIARRGAGGAFSRPDIGARNRHFGMRSSARRRRGAMNGRDGWDADDDALRLGRLEHMDHAMARAAWAARRLAARRWSLASPAAVARFEGRRPRDGDAMEAPPGWTAFARARGAAWTAAVRGLRCAVCATLIR